MNVHLCPKSLIKKKNSGKKSFGPTYFSVVQNWVNFVNFVKLLIKNSFSKYFKVKAVKNKPQNVIK